MIQSQNTDNENTIIRHDTFVAVRFVKRRWRSIGVWIALVVGVAVVVAILTSRRITCSKYIRDPIEINYWSEYVRLENSDALHDHIMKWASERDCYTWLAPAPGAPYVGFSTPCLRVNLSEVKIRISFRDDPNDVWLEYLTPATDEDNRLFDAILQRFVK